jgi:hypothetical protein
VKYKSAGNITSTYGHFTSSDSRVPHSSSLSDTADTFGIVQNGEPFRYSVTLGRRTEQNLYMAELAAIAATVKRLPLDLMGRQITIFSNNQAALLAVIQPQQQSGQTSIRQIYDTTQASKKGGNRVRVVWVPSSEDFEPTRKAKEAARQATEQGRNRDNNSPRIGKVRARRLYFRVSEDNRRV